MINATRCSKVATGLTCFVALGLLLGRNLSFYRLEEILICWLVFSLAFVLLGFAILAGILLFCAGECLIHRVSTAPRVISTVALRLSESLLGNSLSGRSK
jgi:hypothetical protein